jgi:tryptophan-rich sensory protein
VQTFRSKVGWLVALPFVINLVDNLIFTQIELGMRNLPLPAADILVVWATTIWRMVAVWPHSKWAAIAQGVVFRVGVAGDVLQLSITGMNR